MPGIRISSGDFLGSLKEKTQRLLVFPLHLHAWADPSFIGLTVNCDPLVKVLSLRQHNRLSKVTAPQSCFRMFQEFILMGAFGNVLLGFECF